MRAGNLKKLVTNMHVRLTSSARTLQFLIRERTKGNREEKLIVLHIFSNWNRNKDYAYTYMYVPLQPLIVHVSISESFLLLIIIQQFIKKKTVSNENVWTNLDNKIFFLIKENR